MQACLPRAMAWAADAGSAACQTLNITNGDVFSLRDAWPEIAALFGLAEQRNPAAQLRGLLRAAGKHCRLECDCFPARTARTIRLSDCSGNRITISICWAVSGSPDKAQPVLLSTIKLRQAGFAGCRDSLSSLLAQLAAMTDLHLLPPLPNIHLPGASS